jgi:hypothetical protein
VADEEARQCEDRAQDVTHGLVGGAEQNEAALPPLARGRAAERR